MWCVIIFKSKDGTIPWGWTYCQDYHIATVFKESRATIYVEMITDKGSWLKCKYNNKMVDCLNYSSCSGGVTEDILVPISSYFDEIYLFCHFPCSPSPSWLLMDRKAGLTQNSPCTLMIRNTLESVLWCYPCYYVMSLGRCIWTTRKRKTYYKEKGYVIQWKYDLYLPTFIQPIYVISILNDLHKLFSDLKENKSCLTMGSILSTKNC